MAGREIGLVGVGPWGAHILRDLRALGATVHAAARFPDSIARAKAGGAASICASPEHLPQSCAGYVVANRTTSHLDAVEALLPRRRPIFVEKPLGVDLARIRRLPAIAHDLVFVMHKWRYHPGIIELARIASDQRFGSVQGLRTLRVGCGNPHRDVSSLWVYAPHELSIALAILGETPRVVSATADPVQPKPDGAIARLVTRAGLPAVIEVSSGHAVSLRRIIMRCSERICMLDGADYTKITVSNLADRASHTIPVADDMPLLVELRAFIEHLDGGPAPVTPLREEMEIVGAIAQIEVMIAA